MKSIETVLRFFFSKPMMAFLAIVLSGQVLLAENNKVDIGIFRVADDEVEIRVRPRFTMTTDQGFSEIRYTLRWPDDPAINITSLHMISPFNLGVDVGSEVTDGGYSYATYITMAPGDFPVEVQAGEEIVVSRFNHSGGNSAPFEIVLTQDIVLPNTDYYFEYQCKVIEGEGPCDFLGVADVTGIIYVLTATPIPLSKWSIALAMVLVTGAVIVLLKRRL